MGVLHNINQATIILKTTDDLHYNLVYAVICDRDKKIQDIGGAYNTVYHQKECRNGNTN